MKKISAVCTITVKSQVVNLDQLLKRKLLRGLQMDCKDINVRNSRVPATDSEHFPQSSPCVPTLICFFLIIQLGSMQSTACVHVVQKVTCR